MRLQKKEKNVQKPSRVPRRVFIRVQWLRQSWLVNILMTHLNALSCSEMRLICFERSVSPWNRSHNGRTLCITGIFTFLAILITQTRTAVSKAAITKSIFLHTRLTGNVQKDGWSKILSSWFEHVSIKRVHTYIFPPFCTLQAVWQDDKKKLIFTSLWINYWINKSVQRSTYIHTSLPYILNYFLIHVVSVVFFSFFAGNLDRWIQTTSYCKILQLLE